MTNNQVALDSGLVSSMKGCLKALIRILEHEPEFAVRCLIMLGPAP